MKRKIEILAPAGSYEGMKAAMNAGCDAVYIGGSSFGARAYANNLDEATLLHAIDEAHIRGKHLYLTVNTLVKEQERIEQLYQFLEKYYLQGLDAVIVQDVGVMHFIHQHFPELPIHASTQTTLTMAEGANLLRDYGVTRLVTARELNLQEIKNIRENTDLEIETFVHGALCYCYSGQCLMSSMIGGRSGNRGRCAQPCRMPYQFYNDERRLSSNKEKYLLSPKDINTIPLIPELVEAGIDSFKIEGRMKRPEYAAAVSAMYRKYVDYYLEYGKEKYLEFNKKNDYRRDLLALQDIYNRGGFSQGYGKSHNGKDMMSLYRPNHSGVFAGKVTEIKGIQVAIKLQEDINAQDILEIRHNEENIYEFTVKDPHKKGDILIANVGRRLVDRSQDKNKKDKRKSVQPDIPVRIGDSVYRTKNNELLEQISKDYLEKERKIGITGVLTARQGEELRLSISYGNCTVTATQGVVSQAVKQPVSKEKLAVSIEKTGDTLFYFDKLEIDTQGDIFVPVAWLNEVRREAIHQLEQKVAIQYRRSSINLQSVQEPINKSYTLEKGPDTDAMQISVTIQTEDQFTAVLSYSEISCVYVEYDMFTMDNLLNMAEKAAKAGKEIYLSLPHICRLKEYNILNMDMAELGKNKNIHGFIVKNFEEAALLKPLLSDSRPLKELILNYNMYIYNKEAKVFWREQGIHRFTAPVELNVQELKKLGITDCDMIVYGYQPLMISAQCLFESTQGCLKRKKGQSNSSRELYHKGYLTDRLGKKFYVQTNCRECYNIIYNGQALSLLQYAPEIRNLGPARIRLDFTKESKDEAKQVLSAFTDTFYYGRQRMEARSDYTTGHFKRGID